jgi:hypothetical protein
LLLFNFLFLQFDFAIGGSHRLLRPFPKTLAIFQVFSLQ